MMLGLVLEKNAITLPFHSINPSLTESSKAIRISSTSRNWIQRLAGLLLGSKLLVTIAAYLTVRGANAQDPPPACIPGCVVPSCPSGTTPLKTLTSTNNGS
jgi:hypothetical protein